LVYQLVYHYKKVIRDLEVSTREAIQLLKDPDTSNVWQQRREKMLAETIDVQAFIEWFLSEYPRSRNIMEKNGNVPDRFR
jgi:hypothetical protein